MARRFVPLFLILVLIAFLLPSDTLAAPLRAVLTNIVDETGDVGQSTSLALDANGNPVIAYRDVSNSNLKLAYCHNPACSSATIRTLDTTGNTGTFISMMLNSAGNPVISYNTNSPGHLLFIVCGTPTCEPASVTKRTLDDGTTPGPTTSPNTGRFSSLQLDLNGNPVISYARISSSGIGLWLAYCGDITCSSVTLTTLRTGAVQYNSLALDLNGKPVMAYYHSANVYLGLLRCSDSACTGSKSDEMVDSGSGAGQYASMVLDANGVPVIAYFRQTGTLKLAYCDNPNCTSSVQRVLATGESSFRHMSLKLDSAGNPVFSYYGSTSEKVYLLHCSTPTCEPGSVNITTIDSVGFPGGHTSMQLDCSGNAVISYYDAVADDLKLASNDGSGCSPSSPASEGAAASGTNAASKPIDPSGVTTLKLGSLFVTLPAGAIPSGETGCQLSAKEQGGSGAYGFSLDDTVFDVKVNCDSGEINIFFAPLTICIQPPDGQSSNKQVFHNHADGFQALPIANAAAGYVCGQTRLLSLFTLGQFGLPATGFAPGRVTELHAQPAELAYADSDLILDLPTLNVKLSVVGVPKGPNGWDVTWLGPDQTGYLYGTSFPTWQGNTVLTAHVWNADNTPGPFYALKDLAYGDRLIISAYGQTYIYEVRSNRRLQPGSLSPLRGSDYNLITLVTCEGFDPAAGDYDYRRVVQAVLVEVD